MKRQTTLLFTLLAMILSVSSQAGVKSSTTQDDKIVISFDRADLQSSIGRERIEAEIRRVAKLVCGNARYVVTRDLHYANKARNCYRTTVQDSMEQLDQGLQTVTVYH